AALVREHGADPEPWSAQGAAARGEGGAGGGVLRALRPVGRRARRPDERCRRGGFKMSPQEWLRICSHINKVWPHQPIPPPTVEAWYQLLSDLDGEQVSVAVDAIALDGLEFPPQAGRIRRKVVELSDTGQLWGEAWHEVHEAVQRFGCYHDPDQIPWSTEDVRDLVGLKGWEYLCTTTDPASVVEAQCRELWDTI